MKIPEPRKLPSGNYFIQLRLGGESISVTEANRAACIREARAIKAEYLAGKRVKAAPEAPTLTEAIDAYITERSNTLSPLTIRGYRTIQKYRFQTTMPRRLDQIDDSEWQGIVNTEAALCAPKTLRTAFSFVRGVVWHSTGHQLPEVSLAAPVPKEKPFLTPEQILVFVAAVKDTRYAVPALLALSSLRISEIQALQWENIPDNPDFIRVQGAVVLNENNKYQRKAQNKNATSTRNVPVMIPELTAAIQRDHKPAGPVLDITQNSLRCAIKKICRENNLPDVGVHGLRHSFASLAYHLQVPERIAMEIGGWADATTMHKIYTHIAQSDIQRYQTAMTAFYAGADGNVQKEENH